MKKTVLFKRMLAIIGGPAAGAFGYWLMLEAPQLHAVMCQPLGV